MKNIFYITVFLFFYSCQSPSDSSGIEIFKKNVFETNTYCIGVDVSDDTIVLAASNGGYYKISYELDADGFPSFTNVISQPDHNNDFENDSIDKVIMSNGDEGIIYMLDKYNGGQSGVWFDNQDGISIEPGFTNDYCYQAKYLDIALDESEPDNFFGYTTHVLYSLMKHTDLNENSDDDEFLEYSTSIVRRQINIVPNLDSGQLQSFDLALDECNYIANLNYDSKKIDYDFNKLAIASESEGIIIFEKTSSESFSEVVKFNKPGGEAQSVLSLENGVVGGFSNDKGCYMALLESNTNNVTNYIEFADGYSIKSIDFNEDIFGLATGSDGVQLYQWLGADNVIPYASLDTNYAYDLKIKGNLVFVATRQGLEIYKIGS